MSELEILLRQGDLSAAFAHLAANPGVTSSITRVALERALGPTDGLDAAIDHECARVVATLQRRFETLQVLATVAVLLGSLGSIVAASWPSRSTLDPPTRLQWLAGGLAEALTCTVAGFVVCAVIVVGRQLLRARADALGARVREEAAALKHLLRAHRNALHLGSLRANLDDRSTYRTVSHRRPSVQASEVRGSDRQWMRSYAEPSPGRDRAACVFRTKSSSTSSGELDRVSTTGATTMSRLQAPNTSNSVVACPASSPASRS